MHAKWLISSPVMLWVSVCHGHINNFCLYSHNHSTSNSQTCHSISTVTNYLNYLKNSNTNSTTLIILGTCLQTLRCSKKKRELIDECKKWWERVARGEVVSELKNKELPCTHRPQDNQNKKPAALKRLATQVCADVRVQARWCHCCSAPTQCKWE